MYLFMAALGLHCCMWAFSSCGRQGRLFTVVCGLLIVLTSLVAAPRPWSAGSVVVAHVLSYPEVCGILPDQGSNLCALHWLADSQPVVDDRRSPWDVILK